VIWLPTSRMLRDNQSALENQKASLVEEMDALEAHKTDRTALAELAERTRKDYDYYTRKLIYAALQPPADGIPGRGARENHQPWAVRRALHHHP